MRFVYKSSRSTPRAGTTSARRPNLRCRRFEPSARRRRVRGHRSARAAAVAALATSAVLAGVSSAHAQRPASLGEGAPVGQSGIQLYNFSNYLNNGAGEIVCPASPAPATPYCVPPLPPSTTLGRLERLFAFLQSRGIKNVELYGYPGNPFPSTTSRWATRRARWNCGRSATSTASASRPATAASTRPAGARRSTSRGSSVRTTSVSPGRAAPVASAPTSRRCVPPSSSTSSASSRSRRASGRRTSTTTRPSSARPRASWTTACSRAAGRS